MARKIKIVFMGTPEFSTTPLLTLHKHPEFNIEAVVTGIDKKIGRKQILVPSPVKDLSTKLNIPVLQPLSIKNNKDFEILLKGLKADFFIVVAFGQILPETILNIPKYGSINIHASLLPKYRGASPIESAILNGDSETGISIMKMEKGLDSGPIYSIFREKINEEDTSTTLRQKLSILASVHLPFILKEIKENDFYPIEQNHNEATYCSKIKKEDGLINLKEKTASQIINMIRAYNVWPESYLNLNNKKIKILSAEKDSNYKSRPYEFVELENKLIGIGTKKGIIIPKVVQLEGKKAVTIQDFLTGNKKLLIELLETAK